jgi:hypothetical protein
MAQTGSIAVRKTVEFLSAGNTGVNPIVAQLANDAGVALAPLPPAHIVNQNVAFELTERAKIVKYPVIHVYVDRVRNQLTEKFRVFSGKARTVAEVRVSEDRIDGIEEQLRLYVDAITGVLDANRGSWGEGAFFAGGYEVAFEPVKHGGKNFIQIAKVSFDVDLSK